MQTWKYDRTDTTVSNVYQITFLQLIYKYINIITSRRSSLKIKMTSSTNYIFEGFEPIDLNLKLWTYAWCMKKQIN